MNKELKLLCKCKKTGRGPVGGGGGQGGCDQRISYCENAKINLKK